jgi:hypothetical protein
MIITEYAPSTHETGLVYFGSRLSGFSCLSSDACGELVAGSADFPSAGKLKEQRDNRTATCAEPPLSQPQRRLSLLVLDL